VFLTSKVSITSMGLLDEAAASVDRMLAELGTDYLDLVLVHFPSTFPHQLQRTNPGVSAAASFEWSQPVEVWAELRLVLEGGVEAGFECRRATWKALERKWEEGSIRHLGTSNFLEAHLEEMRLYSSSSSSSSSSFGNNNISGETPLSVAPSSSLDLVAVNQVELHPFLPRTSLLEYCDRQGIAVEVCSDVTHFYS
jgi:diketogulonate reductase-like aldo/keto reductase